MGTGNTFKPLEQVNVQFRLLKPDCTAYTENHNENFLIMPESLGCSELILGIQFITRNRILSKTRLFAGPVAVQTPGDDFCPVSREAYFADMPATSVPG